VFIGTTAHKIHIFPSSFGQQRLWFIDQYEPGTDLYNIPAAWRVQGKLDRDALEQSLKEIVRRHEVLRTTFASEGEEPMQIVAEYLDLNLEFVDLSAYADAEERVQRLVLEEAQRPFDLGTGPLIRVGLIKLDEGEHIFLLTLHHIISDGWSMGVLIRELSALYRAFSAGQPSPLSDLPIQYADFAVWQREGLQGEVLQEQLGFWKRTLEGAPPVLELPTDRPRPATLTHHGASVGFELSAELSTQLRKLSQRSQVTLFMTMAAVFNVLLHRYSHQTDICIGYPVANRNREEIEGLIGFFVNTLVLRTRLIPEQTFDGLLKQVWESILDSDAHLDLPFEKLVEELRPGRNLSHSLLFQVMLALNHAGDNTEESALNLSGLMIQSIPDKSDIAKFELSLALTERNGQFLGAFKYNTDLFDRATIERMVGHYKVLLEAVVANPQVKLKDLPLLTEAERHQLLVEWNDTKADFPSDKCIHQLFEEQVEKNRDAVAVIFEDRQLTYGELNARANQLAHQLRDLGVKSDTLVAICVERSLEMVVGLLGILKAGGAYVPLDPEYPQERLTYMLQDTAAPVLLTQGSLKDRLPEHTARTIYLDTDWASIAQRPAANLETTTLPQHLAYCIYTSGSTGKPKGVLICHVGLTERIYSAALSLLQSTDAYFPATASVAFDIAFLELFGPLVVGGTVEVFSKEVVLDIPQLTRRVSKATCLHFVPTLMQKLIEYSRNGSWSHMPQGLRQILVGGERVSRELYGQVQQVFEGVCITVLYGPTEASIICINSGRQSILDCVGDAVIGRPLTNTQIYILDEELNPVPVGVSGEIHISGVGLARGYLNRPDLTAEKFIPNPFGEAGSRMYKTGDLGRYLSDGNIEFLGRIDHQVKIRGFRIELGEVESALLDCDGVREAVVAARGESPGDKRLVAYVVAKVPGDVAANDLRTQLQRSLPEYMVPSAWVFLDALPLNPNGKIDRKALPAPDGSRADLGVEYVAPRTPTEALLADIWAEVLKVDRIGIHDNFFELGGYSLRVMQVASILRSRYQCSITVKDVFGTRDLEELAQRLIMTGGLPASREIIRFPAFIELSSTLVGSNADKAEPYLASHRLADEVLWNAKHLDPTRTMFHYEFAVHIHASLAPSFIRQALRSVVNQHPVLTSHLSITDKLVWVNEGIFEDIEFEVVSLTGDACSDSITAATNLISQWDRRPFNRLEGPLCRFRLIMLPKGDSVLFAQLDHILFDLQSQHVVLRDLAIALQLRQENETLQTLKRPPLYSSYCKWHRGILTADYWRQLENYWKEQFSTDLEPYHALFGSPDDNQLPQRWQNHKWVLGQEQTSTLVQ